MASRTVGPAFTALGIALLFHPAGQTLIDAFLEQPELLVEQVGKTFVAGIDRKGHTPDLLALVAPKVVEEFAEAGQQIAFGEQEVDRETDTQVLVQFTDAQTDRL